MGCDYRYADRLLRLMALRRTVHRLPCLPDEENPKYKEFEAAFPYEPTLDQEVCFAAVSKDMLENTRPMDRLIIGDVGFGKTEVAMRAAYRAVLSGRQVAVLAPTRILAVQHENTFKARMPDFK